MGAVAKRLGRGGAASTKRHAFFNRIRISGRIFQFNDAFDDVGAVLNDLNCYVSHGANLSDKSRIRQAQEPMARTEVVLRDETCGFDNKCPMRSPRNCLAGATGPQSELSKQGSNLFYHDGS